MHYLVQGLWLDLLELLEVLKTVVEIVSVTSVCVRIVVGVFWFHVGHLLSSEVLLVLLLDVLYVVLNLGHRLLHRLAGHLLLDHAVYLLLLLIAKNSILSMILTHVV